MKKIVLLLSLAICTFASTLTLAEENPTTVKFKLYQGGYDSFEGWKAHVENLESGLIKVKTSEGHSAIYKCVDHPIYGLQCSQFLSSGGTTCGQVQVSFVGAEMLIVNFCQRKAYYFYKNFMP
jgi:hypothetical protein